MTTIPYVNVPNDLSKIKTKVAFNLTKRQLICFGCGAAVGIPSYLLARTVIGNTGGLFTKTVEYEDINYSVASTEDQSAIFNGWSAFLNYFDSTLPFQLSFVNRRSHAASRYKVNIPMQAD